MLIPHHSPIVFFDAAALVSAAGSPLGGAAAILDLHRKRHITVAISDSVRTEAERNAARKLRGVSAPALRSMIDNLSLRFIVTPAIEGFPFPRINEKDRHVYAGALLAHADYIVTHDRALIAEINAQGGVRALTPGDFLQQVAPTLVAENGDSSAEV